MTKDRKVVYVYINVDEETNPIRQMITASKYLKTSPYYIIHDGFDLLSAVIHAIFKKK